MIIIILSQNVDFHKSLTSNSIKCRNSVQNKKQNPVSFTTAIGMTANLQL